MPAELTALILQRATSRGVPHQNSACSNSCGGQEMAQVAALRLVCAEFRELADREVLRSLTLTSWPGPSRSGCDLVRVMKLSLWSGVRTLRGRSECMCWGVWHQRSEFSVPSVGRTHFTLPGCLQRPGI